MKGFFDKLVKAGLIVLIAVAGIYILQNKDLFAQACNKPITYKIGRFDTQFGITQSQFTEDMDKAVSIWESPTGRDLFKYDQQNGKLTVNLIYDQRQAATTQLQSLGIQIKDDKTSYNNLLSRYQNLKNEYEVEKGTLDAAVRSYQIAKASYESQVQYWNSKGGAPQGQYNQLQAQKQQLDAEVSSIKAKQDALNKLASDINVIVDSLNRLASVLNLNVTDYNHIGAQTGDEFEEGVYKSDASGQEIDIYQFETQDKLVRVLAHELGHALGLDHVGDPQAIMYKLNQGTSNTATQADLDELKHVCNIK